MSYHHHGPQSSRKRNKLPERWNDYTKIGNIISGTRIMPLKTPLREEICRRSLVGKDWFTPYMLLEEVPDIKLIIDLTQTDRFYRREDFLSNGVRYEKIFCPGGGKQLPQSRIISRFNGIIDNFMDTVAASDKNALIGVHCTHGLNRTGYLICKYMVERCGFTPTCAIKAFEDARGHKMERELYVEDIKNSINEPEEEPHVNNFEDNSYPSRKIHTGKFEDNAYPSRRQHVEEFEDNSYASRRKHVEEFEDNSYPARRQQVDNFEANSYSSRRQRVDNFYPYNRDEGNSSRHPRQYESNDRYYTKRNPVKSRTDYNWRDLSQREDNNKRFGSISQGSKQPTHIRFS